MLFVTHFPGVLEPINQSGGNYSLATYDCACYFAQKFSPETHFEQELQRPYN